MKINIKRKMTIMIVQINLIIIMMIDKFRKTKSQKKQEKLTAYKKMMKIKKKIYKKMSDIQNN